MKTYSTTVAVGQLIAFFGWVMVGIAGILLILSLGDIRSFGGLGIIPSIAMAISGLLLVSQGQLIQVVADTARNTAELVELYSRTELEKRAFPAASDRKGDPPAAEPVRTQTRPGAPPPPQSSDEEMYQIQADRAKLDPQSYTNQYRGYTIVNLSTKDKNSYRAAGSHFETIEDAADFVDSILHATHS